MIHNYHTHTRRCNHAAGEDREYVEAAIKAGIKTLGFSDHSPYLFPKEAGSYYSSFRMRPEQLFDYVSSIESLRQEFKGQIRILTGVEIEYYPKSFPATEKFLRDSGVQYLLLGQHCFGEEYEKGAIFLILLFVVVIVAFNVFSSLSMLLPVFLSILKYPRWTCETSSHVDFKYCWYGVSNIFM